MEFMFVKHQELQYSEGDAVGHSLSRFIFKSADEAVRDPRKQQWASGLVETLGMPVLGSFVVGQAEFQETKILTCKLQRWGS